MLQIILFHCGLTFSFIYSGFDVKLFDLYVVKPINLFFYGFVFGLCLESSFPGQDYINIYIFLFLMVFIFLILTFFYILFFVWNLFGI